MTGVDSIGVTIDGGGSVITTGFKGFIRAPFTGTITAATVLSTDESATSGSISIDVWKDTYANYPPTDADSICSASCPSLSSANKSEDSSLSGWTTSVTQGDVIGFNVDSVSTVTRVTLILTVVAASVATVTDNSIVNGRLTTESGVPVSTSDRTSQSTIYFTPYHGNRIALYDGTEWTLVSFSELSLALSGLTSGKNYDVFVSWNSGSPALALSAAWTNDTTRADTIALQDGVWVKSGSPTYRFIGTIRTTSTTTTEDSAANRFVWNAQNQTRRTMKVVDSTDSWTYTLAAWRQARGSTANQLNFVVGLTASDVQCQVNALVNHSPTVTVSTGVGVDSTSTNSAIVYGRNTTGTAIDHSIADWSATVAAGYHYLAWLEWSTASGTTTWYGDAGLTVLQSGMWGTLYN